MKEETKQKIRQYDQQYKKLNYRRFTLRLNKNTDADLIAYLESKDDMNNFIKDLIMTKFKEET